MIHLGGRDMPFQVCNGPFQTSAGGYIFFFLLTLFGLKAGFNFESGGNAV